jgi:hypothetical protein
MAKVKRTLLQGKHHYRDEKGVGQVAEKGDVVEVSEEMAEAFPHYFGPVETKTKAAPASAAPVSPTKTVSSSASEKPAAKSSSKE